MRPEEHMNASTYSKRRMKWLPSENTMEKKDVDAHIYAPMTTRYPPEARDPWKTTRTIIVSTNSQGMIGFHESHRERLHACTDE